MRDFVYNKIDKSRIMGDDAKKERHIRIGEGLSTPGPQTSVKLYVSLQTRKTTRIGEKNISSSNVCKNSKFPNMSAKSIHFFLFICIIILFIYLCRFYLSNIYLVINILYISIQGERED